MANLGIGSVFPPNFSFFPFINGVLAGFLAYITAKIPINTTVKLQPSRVVRAWDGIDPGGAYLFFIYINYYPAPMVEINGEMASLLAYN